MVRMMHQGFVILAALSCFFCCGILATEDKKHHLRALPCPNPEDIVPCVCTALRDNHMEMDCSYVTSNTQLASIFSDTVFSFKDFESFIMTNNFDLTSIRSGDLGVDITFKNIIIDSGSLATIESNAFMYSYNTLRHLEIRNTGLLSFPFGEIAMFNQLITLDFGNNHLIGFPVMGSTTLKNLVLSSNPLREISSASLVNLQALEYVDLYNTGISYIFPGTFTGLPWLDYINLGNNELQVLASGAISLHTSGNTVYLQNNILTEIEEGALTGLNGILQVTNNQLPVLAESVFRPIVESGAYFLAANNPLLCGCDIAWLVTSPSYMSHLLDAATCHSGDLVSNLDSDMYSECP